MKHSIRWTRYIPKKTLKTIARLKETRNIDIILQVKGNQKKLLERCIDLTQTGTASEKYTQVDKRKRNRIEKRTVQTFLKGTHDLGDTWNENIKTIITIERKNQVFNTTTKQFDLQMETAFYISTTETLSAKQFGKAIRSHWGIENSNHYVRDVTLREDFSRVRKNPENVAVLRSFALNLLRMNGEDNISQALYRNALSLKRVLEYEGIKRVER